MLSTLATTMYAAALMTLLTMLMTGMSECSAKSEVTYALRLYVIEDWNAFQQ